MNLEDKINAAICFLNCDVRLGGKTYVLYPLPYLLKHFLSTYAILATRQHKDTDKYCRGWVPDSSQALVYNGQWYSFNGKEKSAKFVKAKVHSE